MLLHTILFALVASLATAAPVADAAEAFSPRSPPDSLGDDGVGQAGRDNRPGLSVYCFDQRGCTDSFVYGQAGFYDIPFDEDRQIFYFARSFNQDFSCRFDTWNGWMGEFYMEGLANGKLTRISGSNYSGGSGQACVDKYPHPRGTSKLTGLRIVVKRWKPQA